LKEIQKSYRRKALTCHPDKHNDDPVKVALFLQITQALDILTDTAKRAAYDGKHKARKLRAKRKRDLDDKSRKFRDELDAREQEAERHKRNEDDTRTSLAQEIARLRDEGLRRIREQEAKERAKQEEARKKKDQLHRTLKLKWGAGHMFTKEELHKLFGAFGTLEHILVGTKGDRAVIVYENIQPAITSERAMHKHPMYKFEAVLAYKEFLDTNTDGAEEIGMEYPENQDMPARSTVGTSQDMLKSHADFEAHVLAQLQHAAQAKKRQKTEKGTNNENSHKLQPDAAFPLPNDVTDDIG